MILRNLVRGCLFRYNNSYPYGQEDVKCMPDNTYTSSIYSGYDFLNSYGTNNNWTASDFLRIIISEDEVTPNKDMYTMPFKDIIPDSTPQLRNFGYVSDTTSGSDRPRKVIKQSYTNSTGSTITVKTLGLVFSGASLNGTSSSGATTVENAYGSGVVLVAVQPLDEPVTINAGETITFQMTLYLCE